MGEVNKQQISDEMKVHKTFSDIRYAEDSMTNKKDFAIGDEIRPKIEGK